LIVVAYDNAIAANAQLGIPCDGKNEDFRLCCDNTGNADAKWWASTYLN
jgi:hypothetical protein